MIIFNMNEFINEFKRQCNILYNSNEFILTNSIFNVEYIPKKRSKLLMLEEFYSIYNNYPEFVEEFIEYRGIEIKNNLERIAFVLTIDQLSSNNFYSPLDELTYHFKY